MLINILSLLISPRNFFLGEKASKQATRKKGRECFGSTNSELQESKQGECFGDTNSELHESKRREKLANACFSKPNVRAKITVPRSP